MAKKTGPVPCALCDRSFGTDVGMQQHVRDKHTNIPTQVPPVQVDPPEQPPATPPPGVICGECHASFPSPGALRQHKIASHGWKCIKCPFLPPFEGGTAWQAHFNEVHAANTQSGTDKGTEAKKIATPTEESKPSKTVSGAPERSQGLHHGEIVGHTNAKAHSVATRPESSQSSIENGNHPVVSAPPPEVTASGGTQGEVISSASATKVCESSKHIVESRNNLSFLTSQTESQPAHQTTSNDDQTVRVDERNLLSPKEPNLNTLIEIDPEPHRGRDETTYELASDVSSPTTTVSSLETNKPEEEDDVGFPSCSFGLVNGSSLEKHINGPPRGPELGGRKSNAVSNAIVAGNRSGGEPNAQSRGGPGGVTPPTTKEQYEGTMPDSPTSTVSSTQDAAWGPNQVPWSGDLPHDPLRARRSKTGSTTSTRDINFKCRICFSDPTPESNLTATHCGHLFCYECIATDVLRTSRCPVCRNVLAVYCLFKLDMAS